MKLAFTSQGWDDYLYWQIADKKLLRKINELIRDTQRDPFNGIGKPEPLKGNLAGLWSRRITDEHRLVYEQTANELIIHAARYHYSR